MFSISNFGNIVRNIRKDKKLSLKEVAENGGLSHPYLSQIENNKRNAPKPDMVKKLAKGLNVPYVFLLSKAGYLDEQVDSETMEKLQSEWEKQPHHIYYNEILGYLQGASTGVFNDKKLTSGQDLVISGVLFYILEKFTDQDNPLTLEEFDILTRYFDLLPEIMKLNSDEMRKLISITKSYLK